MAKPRPIVSFAFFLRNIFQAFVLPQSRMALSALRESLFAEYIESRQHSISIANISLWILDQNSNVAHLWHLHSVRISSQIDTGAH